MHQLHQFVMLALLDAFVLSGRVGQIALFLLARITGITDREELKDLLADSIEELRGALARVHADAPT